jgi:hypothetical protein
MRLLAVIDLRTQEYTATQVSLGLVSTSSSWSDAYSSWVLASSVL